MVYESLKNVYILDATTGLVLFEKVYRWPENAISSNIGSLIQSFYQFARYVTFYALASPSADSLFEHRKLFFFLFFFLLLLLLLLLLLIVITFPYIYLYDREVEGGEIVSVSFEGSPFLSASSSSIGHNRRFRSDRGLGAVMVITSAKHHSCEFIITLHIYCML
jgi:hypothetical protein